MAYVEKYRAEWASRNRYGYLRIEEKDYSGAIIDIKLSDKVISVNRDTFDDWESYVIGTTLEFEVVNDRTNYFDLLELMTATERQFKIILEDNSEGSEIFTLFEGFLNCDVSSQRYLHKQLIRLVASSYISKLKHIEPTSIDTLQNMSFINIIDEILRSTGSYHDIRVNCSLYANDDTLSAGQTLFNKNGFYTEVFWKDNINRNTGIEILKSILKTFNCYIYWWNGYWYIEQFRVLWTTPTLDYVEYTTGSSYGPADSGSVVSSVSRGVDDVHDLQFIEQSQKLTVIPGYKIIRVIGNLEQGLLLNLVINDFSDATAISGVVPYPDYRTWQYWDDSDLYLAWIYSGSYNNISNTIFRQWWKGGIDYISGSYIFTPDDIEWYRGIYTRFKITIGNDNKINIKFKFGIDADSIYQEYTGDLSDYEFLFHYYLRLTPGGYYIMYNETTELWEVQYSSTESGGLQSILVDGDEFDPNNMTCEVEKNINIDDLGSSYYGDQSLVLCIATEEITRKDGAYQNLPAHYCWYGDVIVTTNNTLESDVIDGEINTDFLNKKEIEIDILDNVNKNYKNGVLRGADLDMPTENWTLNGTDYFTLVEWLFKNKFRMYHLTRQKIASRVFSTDLIRPLQLYTESKQSDKKFIIMSVRHIVTEDVYDVILFEFDNDTVVNLL